MQEVEKYREMLKTIQSGSATNASSLLLANAIDVSYYIRKNDLQKADESFQKAEKIYMQSNQPYLQATYLFTSRSAFIQAICR